VSNCLERANTTARGERRLNDDPRQLLRTTESKLTRVYLSIFAAFAAFLLGYFAWNMCRLARWYPPPGPFCMSIRSRPGVTLETICQSCGNRVASSLLSVAVPRSWGLAEINAGKGSLCLFTSKLRAVQVRHSARVRLRAASVGGSCTPAQKAVGWRPQLCRGRVA
jgi:hypothetical protein